MIHTLHAFGIALAWVIVISTLFSTIGFGVAIIHRIMLLYAMKTSSLFKRQEFDLKSNIFCKFNYGLIAGFFASLFKFNLCQIYYFYHNHNRLYLFYLSYSTNLEEIFFFKKLAFI